MDANDKILKEVRRIRHAYNAMGQDLETLENELKKFQAPAPERKRRDLKTARVEHFAQIYASGKWARKAK